MYISTERKIFLGIGVFTILAFAGGVFLVSRQDSKTSSVLGEQVISRSGMHWHPHISIFIKGEKQEIPSNVGIGAIHQPIHTHDATGELHLEFSGVVTKDDVRLGKFFKIWGKQLSSSCIFDKCNGEEGKVKLLVNGKENQEFEKYEMKDKDRIEIRYE